MTAGPKYTKRTSGIELPGAVELLDILAKESPRKALRFDYLQIHDQLFAAHHELAKLAGTDSSWSHTYPKLTLEQLVDEVIVTHAAMTHFIEQHPSTNETYQKVFTSLTLPPISHTSDAIFVFGSMTNVRAEKAVELYKNNVAPKIILSGDGPHYHDNEGSEAERMAQYAREAGVPDSALLLEDRSVTLPDNVKRTIDMLEGIGWRPSSITIVATNFVLRRAAMEWYKFAPWDIQIYAEAPRVRSPCLTSDKWHENTDSIALVLNEYAKMILESKIDLMRSID